MSIRDTADQNGPDTLAFFIEDDRYSVPTLQFRGGTPDAVPRLAERLLRESAHHRAVEVRRDDKVIYAARRRHLAGTGSEQAE